MREAANAEYVNKKYLRTYNCGYQEFLDTNATLSPSTVNSAKYLWWHYRKSSQRKKIPFTMTYQYFISVVKDHLGNFGRSKMVLKMDQIPLGYSEGNIKVMSQSECVKLTRTQEKILKLYKKGMGPTEISKKLGLERQGVQLHLANAKNRLIVMDLQKSETPNEGG